LAGRAIAGIALGMLFLPVILIFSFGSFWPWITSITVDFNAFIMTYVGAGMGALNVPLLDLFTPLYTINTWLAAFAISIIAWAIIGMWAGAIERSAGRGIGVAVGIWLGWLIIQIIYLAVMGIIAVFLNALLAEWFSLVIAIIFAAIFGAITKSEEF
jgi:hypothetical protein